MIRKRRKIRTLRGSRNCAGGNPKKRRGAGNRGGRGLAGSGKGKKTKADWVRINLPDHLGRRGFKRPAEKVVQERTLNVLELDQNVEEYIAQGAATQKGDTITVDLEKVGITKVLGKGRVTRKLSVSARGFSESAVKKIEEKGGKANVVGR